MLPKEVENSQNNSANKTRQGKHKERFKIQTNKFNKCRRQSPRENTYQQNYALRLQQQPTEQKPIWIHPPGRVPQMPHWQ